MTQENINSLLELRSELIGKFERLKDYKSNKNALIKEIDVAEMLHGTIVKIDAILKDYVTFSRT